MVPGKRGSVEPVFWGGQELQEDPGWNAFGTREDSIPEFKRRHDPALKALSASRIVQL